MFGSYFIVENRDLGRKNGFFTYCQTGNSKMDFERGIFKKQGIFKRNFKKSTFFFKSLNTFKKKAELWNLASW